jgi:hypothetical protein
MWTEVRRQCHEVRQIAQLLHLSKWHVYRVLRDSASTGAEPCAAEAC